MWKWEYAQLATLNFEGKGYIAQCHSDPESNLEYFGGTRFPHNLAHPSISPWAYNWGIFPKKKPMG